MIEPHRRTTDDIEQLIASEDDPKQRALLLMLYSINNSVLANTDATKRASDTLTRHIDQFKEHVEMDAAIMNKGSGAWKVMAWVVGGVQAVGLALWLDFRKDTEYIHEALNRNTVAHVEFNDRLAALEKVKHEGRKIP